MWVRPRPRSWLVPARPTPGPGRERRPRPSPGTGARPSPPTTGSPSGSLTSVPGPGRRARSARAARTAPPCGRSRGSRARRATRPRSSRRAARGWPPVISTGSPVSRVAASTREQRLTASPMTLKLRAARRRRSRPATTRPVLTPTPTSKSPGRRLLIVRAISTAHCTARSACWGKRSGAPKTASTPSPMNWSMCPRWRATIGTMHSKSSLSRATTSDAVGLGRRRGEVADVAEDERDLDLLARAARSPR